MTMRFALPLPLLVLGVVLAWPSEAHACTCEASRSPEAAFIQADAVFRGRVLAVEAVGDRPYPEYPERMNVHYRLVQLQVTRSWKGVTERAVTIATGAWSDDCGYAFERGREYVIYAFRSEPLSSSAGASTWYDSALPLGFYTTHCTRTARVADAAVSLRHLSRKPALVLKRH